MMKLIHRNTGIRKEKITNKNNFKMQDKEYKTTTCDEDFTMIKNSLIRTPILSAKAKGILFLLLSNKESRQQSHISTIVNMNADGRTSIRAGLTELEKHGFLVLLHYKEKKTKRHAGTFWIYTDCPGTYNWQAINTGLKQIETNEYELDEKSQIRLSNLTTNTDK